MSSDEFLREYLSPPDNAALAERLNQEAIKRWMFDPVFVSRGKLAIQVLKQLDIEVTPDVKLGVIIAAHLATRPTP